MHRLDRVAVPNIWSEAVRRSEEGVDRWSGPPRPDRSRADRHGSARLAVAAAVALCVIGALLARGRSDHSVQVAESPKWAVRFTLDLPASGQSRSRSLLATSGAGAWFAQPGDGEVVRVERTGDRLRTTARIAVPPVAAIAADRELLYIVTTQGDVLVSRNAGEPTTAATLGALDPTRVSAVVAGGSLWVTGSATGGLVTVSERSGGTVVGGSIDSPVGLSSAGDDVWVLAGDRRTLFVVDATTNAVRRIARLTEVGSIAADPTGLWVTDPSEHRLVHLDRRTGHLSMVTELGRADPLAQLATTGRSVWFADEQVVQLFDASGKVQATVAVAGGRGPPALATHGDTLWVAANRHRRIAIVERS